VWCAVCGCMCERQPRPRHDPTENWPATQVPPTAREAAADAQPQGNAREFNGSVANVVTSSRQRQK